MGQWGNSKIFVVPVTELKKPHMNDHLAREKILFWKKCMSTFDFSTSYSRAG